MADPDGSQNQGRFNSAVNLSRDKKKKGIIRRARDKFNTNRSPSPSADGPPTQDNKQVYDHPEERSGEAGLYQPRNGNPSTPMAGSPAPTTGASPGMVPIYTLDGRSAMIVSGYRPMPGTTPSAHASTTVPLAPERIESAPTSQIVGSHTFPANHRTPNHSGPNRPLPALPPEARMEPDTANGRHIFDGDDTTAGALPPHTRERVGPTSPSQSKTDAVNDGTQRPQSQPRDPLHPETTVPTKKSQFDEDWLGDAGGAQSAPSQLPPKVESRDVDHVTANLDADASSPHRDNGSYSAVQTIEDHSQRHHDSRANQHDFDLLRQQLADRDAALYANIEEVERISEKLSSTKHKLVEQDRQLTDLTGKLEAKERELKAMERQLHAAGESTTIKADEYKRALSKKTAEIMRLDGDCAALSKKNKESDAECVRRGQENSRLIRDYEAKIKSLKVDADSYFKHAMRSEQQRMDTALNDLTRQKDGDINDRDQTIEKLQKEIMKLGRALAGKEEVHAKELEQQNKDHRATINKLQEGSLNQRVEHRNEMEKLCGRHDMEIRELKIQHGIDKEIIRGEHEKAEQEMHEEHKREQARMEKDNKKLWQDLKNTQEQHTKELTAIDVKHKHTMDSLITKQELELGERDQKFNATVTSHEQEIKDLKGAHQRDLESQLKGLRDTVKGLSAALVARNIPKDIKQLDDGNLKNRFSELSHVIDELSRLGWKTNQRTWTEQTLATLSANETLRSVKKTIIQDSIWSLLQEYIFASPFRIFGDEGKALEQQWYEAFNTDKQPPGETYAWPIPSWEAERWRYMTIVECRAALMAKSVSEHDKARARARVGFSDSLKRLNEKLRLAVDEIVILENNDALQKLAKRASNIWLECGMQCCRVVVSLANSDPGSKVVSAAEKLQKARPNIGDGSLVLTVHPKIGRYGNASGLDLDEFVEIHREESLAFP